MRQIRLGALLVMFCIIATIGRSSEGPIYLFNPKYIKNSFNAELGLTFFTSFMRSPQLGTAYKFNASTAFPEPIFTYVYSLATITYEPQFRLLEFGHSQSLSLNIPISAGLSAVDVRTGSGLSYDASDANGPISGTSYGTRNSILGWGHAELGGFLAYNLGRSATDENVWPIGFDVAAGYTMIYAPLGITNASDARSTYVPYSRWGHLVGRLGMTFGKIGMHYTLGLDQTTVQYMSPANIVQQIETSIYHKYTMTINL